MQAQLSKQQAIDEITRRLVEFYNPVRIYLFGSEARGDAGPDSDLDFLVVVPDDAPENKLHPGAAGERFSEPDSPKTSCRGARPISRNGRLGSNHPCPLRWCAKDGCSMRPTEARAGRSTRMVYPAHFSFASRPPRRVSRPSLRGTTAPSAGRTIWPNWAKDFQGD